MAIFSAIGGAIAGALFAGSALAASIIGGALAFGANLAISYLTRPKKRAYAAFQDEIQIGGRIPVSAVYGKAATKGHHVYYGRYGEGNKYNADVFVLSNGWCDGLEPEVYFYGEKHALKLIGGNTANIQANWSNKFAGLFAAHGQVGFANYAEFLAYWQDWPTFENQLDNVGYVLNGLFRLIRPAFEAESPEAAFGQATEVWSVDGFNGKIILRFFDGRPGQEADAALVADTADLDNPWRATSRLTGMAYVVVEREWDEELFQRGVPELEFVLRGVREYDPREDDTVAGGDGPQRLDDPATWIWTENPAIHRLNYQLGLRGQISGRTLVGEGKSLGQLDLGTYTTAMNVCDTLREGKATYACSLIVSADDDHTEVLKEFDDAMAGYALNRRGLSGVIAGAPQIPVATIGADDIDSGRPKSMKRRKSAFDLYNHISGQFTSPEAYWRPESLTPITSNLDVAADGRPRQTSNDFLQVTDPDIAQYLLQIRYRQNRKGGSATVPVSRRLGFRVLEGEWISYAGSTWLITNWACDEDLKVTLTLAETGADVYASEGIVPGPIVIPSQPPINPSILTTVQNFNVEVGLIDGGEGHQVPALRFTWDPPEDPTITTVRFEYFIGTDPTGETIYRDQTEDAEAGEYITSKDVQPYSIYTARATIRTVPDRFKTWTPWVTTATATGAFEVYPPGLIEELQNFVDDATEWIGPSVRDLIDDARRLVASVLDQASTDYTDRQLIRQEVVSSNADAKAYADFSILAATGPDSALAQALLSVQAQVAGKADASTVLLLSARVDTVEGSLTAVSNAVIAANAAVGQVSASGAFRAEALAAPGGSWSRIGLSASATSGVTFEQAAIYLDARTSGSPRSRVVVVSEQFAITNGTVVENPFVFVGSTAYLANIVVGWANISAAVVGNLQVTGNMVVNGALTVAKFAAPTAGDTVIAQITAADREYLTLFDTFTGPLRASSRDSVNPIIMNFSGTYGLFPTSVGFDVIVAGTIRLKLEHRAESSGINPDATSGIQVLKNGSQIQLWSTTSSTFVTRSLDIAVAVGDNITVRGRGGSGTYFRNIRVCSGNSTLAVQ